MMVRVNVKNNFPVESHNSMAGCRCQQYKLPEIVTRVVWRWAFRHEMTKTKELENDSQRAVGLEKHQLRTGI
jgi:hypothetical protein